MSAPEPLAAPAPAPPKVAGFSSVGSLLTATCARLADAPAMRHPCRGGWKSLSWREVEQRVGEIACGLLGLGVAHGERVAILADTRWEWAACDLAVLSVGAVVVPIYPSNLPAEVEYVLAHSGARVVVCQDREQLAKILEVRERLPDLRRVVLLEGKVKEGGLTLSFADLLEQGRSGLADGLDLWPRRDAVGPDDVATICYTSGTTGPPKGAVLTHGNLLFEVEALAGVLEVDERDETLLFLPLAHIFARLGMLGSLRLGYTVAFAESIDRAVANMQEVRPTFVLAVPRVYEKVYDKVVGEVRRGGRLKRQLFGFAMAVGRAVSRRRQQGGGVPAHLAVSFRAAQLLVFDKLKATFGGSLRFFVSGGAPLAQEIAEFFHAADILVLEGYGLTETVGAANVNRLDRYRFGTVGPPLPGVEQRLAEDGEILLRGGNLFREYYRRPEATAEAIDAQGWFHTGDIGEIDAGGFLRITDRKKDLIVTSGGKNVAPQNIENQFKLDPFISQVMVHGDRRAYLTALITVPDEELVRFAEARGIAYQNLGEVARHPETLARVERVVAEKNGRLAAYETIKRFAVVWPDFEVGEELTPSLKVRRKFCAEKYQDRLDSLYRAEA